MCPVVCLKVNFVKIKVTEMIFLGSVMDPKLSDTKGNVNVKKVSVFV
jgi:hypothetical protein